MKMQAVILAAGKGSRLHPITAKRSKAMLPVLGKPIVERVMETLSGCGIDEFIVVASPGDENILRYFQEESSFKGKVHLVTQSERMGMAHALLQAAPMLVGDFVLSACDNLISEDDACRLMRLWMMEPRANGTLTLMRIPSQELGKTGIVEMRDGLIQRIVEKPKPEDAQSDIASLPLYVFSRKILNYLTEVKLSPRGEYELQDAIQMLIERDGNVRGLMVERRLTLTSAADLLKINREFLWQGGSRLLRVTASVGEETKFLPPLYIEPGTEIGSHCTIGPNVYIERDCRIEDKVSLRDCVVLRKTVVHTGSKYVGEVVENGKTGNT
ncbi:MAG: hypothetical protein EHM41_09985 [Chloroflexi bacterium]|nr:MAG: hypothetical protein EHM41_09985 [Chloroflexota bacterium]